MRAPSFPCGRDGRARFLFAAVSLAILSLTGPGSAARAAGEWIETSPEAKIVIAVRPGDPDAEGFEEGTEICDLPRGARIALFDAPRASQEDPDYLHVSLAGAPAPGCALLDGWVYRAHLVRTSREPFRASSFNLRVLKGAVLSAVPSSTEGASDERGSDGAPETERASCVLPADVTLPLARRPVWAPGAPGTIAVELLDPLLGCSLRAGRVRVEDVNLLGTTGPARTNGTSASATPVEAVHWVTLGARAAVLRIRPDVDPSTLEPGTGKCALPPKATFVLRQAPGWFDARTVHVRLLEEVEGCAFRFGYLDRSLLTAASSVAGVPSNEDRALDGAPGGAWIQMGPRDGVLAIRADVPASSLQPGTGRCLLAANQRYWVAREPGHVDAAYIQVLFAEPVAGCRFAFGYVARNELAATSRLSGAAPGAGPGNAPGTGGGSENAILGRIVAVASSMMGRGVFELGCPREYRRGTGSVCCARMVSTVLSRARVDVRGSDAVVQLVANLKAKGWKRVRTDMAPPGGIVFHDKTPGVHGAQHVGICATRGCAQAWNSWQQLFSRNAYPSMPSYADFIRRGGSYGGVLVPP